MSQNHYTPKGKRRKISTSRPRKEAQRIARNSAEIKRREEIEKFWEGNPELRKQVEALRAKSDDQIDTSDIPEVDFTGAEVGKFYRGPDPVQQDTRIVADENPHFNISDPDDNSYGVDNG